MGVGAREKDRCGAGGEDGCVGWEIVFSFLAYSVHVVIVESR